MGMMKTLACLITGLAVFFGLHSSVSAAGIQYFLLNYAPDGLYSSKPIGSSAIMNYVNTTFGRANRTSPLKVGISCLYCPGAARGASDAELALMRRDLALAERLNVPILVQVDVENWLPPSLLNWFDPHAAGYDPARRGDVEWYGWNEATAMKLSWRNWGREIRVGPAPNYLSAHYEAYERQVYQEFLPPVVQWYQHLPLHEKWLFVGWKCGWESSLNNNYRFFANGNSYYRKASNPPWNSAIAPIGYNAARTAGIQTAGTITSDTIAKIVGKHLAFLAEMAFRAGIPKNKIFDHGTFYTNCQQNVDALVNPFANPGVSFYGDSAKPLNFDPAFMGALQMARTNHGATGYCYGEFNLFTTNYETWSSWLARSLLNDSNCVYQSLYNYDSLYGKPSVERALLQAQRTAAQR
jgi:hypothetical protein